MSEKFVPKNKAEAIAYEKGFAASETNLLIYLYDLGEGAKDRGDNATWLVCKALYDGVVAGDHMPDQDLTTTMHVSAGECN